MKLRARFSNGFFSRRLRRIEQALAAPVVDAAASALAAEILRSGGPALEVSGNERRRSIGTSNQDDVLRETGTLEQPAQPWLAPALPMALEPMRAAAAARMRDIVAVHAGKRSAAARALSKGK